MGSIPTGGHRHECLVKTAAIQQLYLQYTNSFEWFGSGELVQNRITQEAKSLYCFKLSTAEADELSSFIVILFCIKELF